MASRPLTEEEQAEYLQHSSRCPYCKSEDIEGGSVSINEGQAEQRVCCNACDEDWTDIYTLTAVDDGHVHNNPHYGQGTNPGE